MDTISMMRQVLRHPYDFFYDIQQPNRIRWYQGFVIIALVCIMRMLSIMLTGYAFQTHEPHQISYVQEFFWIIVPWLSWCISNWGVSAILDGEGKFKEVLHGSAFALVPYVVFIVPVTLLSHVLSLEEASIHQFLVFGIYAWSILLLLIKVKIIHDFELGKLLWIVAISLAGIAIIWFVGILMFGLANQFINFIFDLFKEMNLRV